MLPGGQESGIIQSRLLSILWYSYLVKQNLIFSGGGGDDNGMDASKQVEVMGSFCKV